MSDIRHIARQAAEKAQRDITGPDMLDERNRYAVADAVAVAVLREIMQDAPKDEVKFLTKVLAQFQPAPPQTPEPPQIIDWCPNCERKESGWPVCVKCGTVTFERPVSAPLAPAVEPEPPICGCGRVLNVGESTCWICESLPSAVEPMTDPQTKDIKPGDWIRTRDEDMDSTDEPILDVVAAVERRMRYVETWHGQRIPFDDIQEVRRGER